jgi:hypothetical protein
MEDSMDIFMFQKLEEKTARINAIWDFDGNENTLDTRDFDPAELKYILIKEAKRIAQLEAKEKKVLLEDQLTTLEAQINSLEEVQATLSHVRSKMEDIIKAVEYFRDISEDEKSDPNALRRQVVYMMRATKLKDGTTLEAAQSRTKDYYRNPYKDSWINAYQGISTPYWYKDWKADVSALNTATKEVLEPKGLSADEAGIAQAISLLTAEKTKLEEQKAQLSSEEYLKERARQIKEKKAKEGIAAASVQERVQQFSQLNYLLDELRVSEIQESIIGEADDAPYRKGETVMYGDKKAKVEKVIQASNGKVYYQIRQGSYVELVLSDELSPSSQAQKDRLNTESKPKKSKASAKIRLLKAKKAKKLKLLQLAA